MRFSPSDHGVELILFGGFEVRLNGSPVAEVSYNKMRALLAYLAMEQKRDHSRETLADLLWGGSDPETARGNLRRTLADLRRALELPSGNTLFSATKQSIRLTPAVHVDALDFAVTAKSCPAAPTLSRCGSCIKQMEQAAGLYRGEFMAEFSLPDSPDFEDWLQIKRENLHRNVLALLEKLSSCLEKAGEYDKALQPVLRHIALDPWSESAHRRVMRLYALNNQPSAALAQYEACRRVLEKELGVLPSEETRLLFNRIRNGELGRKLPVSASAPLPSIPLPAMEIRQLTVLYCELTVPEVDDPDEALELLHDPQARCVDIIRKFSGVVAQAYGGGLLAYFGYPQADERAARKAVQAALMAARETARGVEIRAGIHTGLVITGGDSSMPDIVGKTSRLAVQLRLCVTHNEVAISSVTHGIVAGYFNCIGMGAHPLPGFAQPGEVLKVAGESGARTRLDAATQLTPLAGRKAEINKLMGLWKKSAQGSRHIVLVRGEAGIGKSRLLHALKQRLANQPHAIREMRCFPEYSQSPFHPVIAMLEAIFGFAHKDTHGQKFEILAHYLKAHHAKAAQEAIPLLAQLLSLPLSEIFHPSSLPPQKQKEQTIAILIGLLQALSAQQPVLLIAEDLHWIDPSTLELLTLFAGQENSGNILALFTARPEFVPPWKEAVITTLALSPLGENEVAEMIASISETIPAAAINRIVESADGVPLFVEEMAKISFMENWDDIPATLHDLLAVRMDQVGDAKYTARLAATIGREFDLDLLRMISPLVPQKLAHALKTLQDAGLVHGVSDTIHQFKHALIQEAAYQSQVKADRQAAHKRIAQTLLSGFPDVAEAMPEVIAQHLSAAGEALQSIEYWIKAGQRAALRSANTEAIGHFNSGLKFLMMLPSGTERDRLESGLRLNLGTALIAARGYGSVEAGQAYSRALELEQYLGDNAGFFNALWGMWFTSSSRISHAHSLEIAGKLLRQAERGNDVLQLQQAHYAMGNSSFMTGNPSAACMHLEQSIALYQPSHHELMVGQYGENICVSSRSILSLALWLQGCTKQAEEASQQALALARQVNHPHSTGYALSTAAILNRWMKKPEATSILAQEAIALARKHGLPLWQGLGASSLGWVLAMQGQQAGVAMIQQCLDAIDDVMSGARIFFLAPLCDALVHLGQFENALDKIRESLLILNAKDSRFFESEFYRLKGVCLQEISPKDTKEAEACFNEAIAISRSQGAYSLQLRAAKSMAYLWQQQGRHEDAQKLLRETCKGFTEAFDAPEKAQWTSPASVDIP